MEKASSQKSFLKDTIKLIRTLAKNDLKARFAGSYLGVIWAFVQPIMMVMVYWFVFEMCLSTGTQGTKAGIKAPFVLWLLSGLVPWFYFQEAWSSATNCFNEYNYLVKKVVFNISILLQIGIWATPIMWNVYSDQMHIPGWAMNIIKINPMFYITDGYREALIGGKGFWEKPALTAYYWCFALVVLFLGVHVFKKLKDNFADVL